MRSALVAVVMLAVLAVVPGRVRADPKPEDTGPQPYRPVLMVFDGFATLFTAGFTALAYHNRNDRGEDFSGEGVIFGLSYYLGGGPFLHHEAGHDGRAVASVVVRVGLPIAAGELAYHEGASPAESLWVAGGGMLAAMAFDWFVLADWTYEPRPKDVGLYVAPASGGGVVAGVGGAL